MDKIGTDFYKVFFYNYFMVYSYVLEHFLVFKNTSLMDKMWPLQFYKKSWGKK